MHQHYRRGQGRKAKSSALDISSTLDVDDDGRPDEVLPLMSALAPLSSNRDRTRRQLRLAGGCIGCCLLVAYVVVPTAVWAFGLPDPANFQSRVWGCARFDFSDGCVVSVHTGVRAELLVTIPKPRRAGWCDAAERELAPLCFPADADEAAKMTRPLLFKDGSAESLETRRRCAEWSYACTRERRPSNVTVWYHHFHKAGGTTFVRTAEANGARLYPWNSNGNPLEAGKGGGRIPFWTYDGAKQAAFANAARRDSGCNLMATEFGFPSPASNLLAPQPYLYITVLREPVARVVSNFFWRYRLYFNGGHAAGKGTPKQRARLKPGQKPDFGEFVEGHIDLYVRTLSGGGTAEPDSPTGALTEADLDTAKRTLKQFSIVLITEWMEASAPLLREHLDWAITDFGAFHEKENKMLKDFALLETWDPDWKARLASLNKLDVSFYKHAQDVSKAQLAGYGIDTSALGAHGHSGKVHGKGSGRARRHARALRRLR